MIQEQEKQIILNGRLVLSKKEKLKHYGVSILLCIVAVITFIITIWHNYFPEESSTTKTLSEMSFIYFYLILAALIIFFINHNALKFESIKGSIDAKQLEETLSRLTKDGKWKKLQHKANCYQYHSFLGDLATRPHQLITLILEKDQLLFNNIRSLRHFGSISLGIFNRDRDILLRHLNAVRRYEDYTKTPEINDTQWNWKMILARLFLYPLCIFFFWISIYHLIPAGNYFIPFIIMVMGAIYICSDLYMIFKN